MLFLLSRIVFLGTHDMQNFENMAYCGYRENIAPFEEFKQLGL
jgi:hypothetical protein